MSSPHRVLLRTPSLHSPKYPELDFLLYVRLPLAAYPGVLEAPKVVLALPETPAQLLNG
jgi:hypothetical protein